MTEGMTTKEHMGHTITFDPETYLFVVEGPEYEGCSAKDCRFQSYADARADIKRRSDESATVKAKAVKLDLAVVIEDGTVGRVERIDRRNSLLTGSFSSSRVIYVYPDLPWVREAIRRQIEFRETAQNLERIAIKVDRGWGSGGMSGPAALAALERVSKEYEEKLKMARNMAEPKIVENVV